MPEILDHRDDFHLKGGFNHVEKYNVVGIILKGVTYFTGKFG